MRRVHRDESIPSSLNTSSSNLNLLISTSNVDLSTSLTTASTTLLSSGNTQNGSVSNDARSKLMISSTTSSIESSNQNSTSTLKAPVLQSILSKTRLNSILNKYDAGQSLAAAAAAIPNNSSSITLAEVQPSFNNQQSLETKSELDEVRIEVDDDCTKQISQIMSQSSVSTSTSSSAAASPQIKNKEMTAHDPSNQSSPTNTNLLLL